MVPIFSKRLRRNFMTIVFFEAFYRLLGNIVVMPFFQLIFKGMLAVNGQVFLRNDNIQVILKNPLSYLFILAMVVLLGIYILIEISVLVRLTTAEEKPSSLLVIGEMSRIDLKHALQRRNIGILLVAFALSLNGTLQLAPGFLDKVAIPNFIVEHIMQNRWESFFFVGAAIALLYGCFLLSFTFHFFFLEGKSLVDAARSSLRLTKGKRMRIVLRLTLATLISAVVLVLLLVVSLLGLMAILHVSMKNDAIAVWIGLIIDQVGEGMKFLFTVLFTTLSIVLLSEYYLEDKGVSGIDSYQPVEQTANRQRVWAQAHGFTKKRMRIGLVVALAITVVLSVATKGVSSHISEFQITVETKITAHRGSSIDYPENTLEALEGAIQDKAASSEIDVQLTKDNRVVLFHDPTLKRMDKSNRRIKDMTLAELKTVDVGSFHDSKFKDVRMPTLEEAIEKVRGKATLNIELKPDGNSAALAKAVNDILVKENFVGDSVLTSLNRDVLVESKKLNPNLRVGYILAIALGDFFKDPTFDLYAIEETFVTQNVVDAIHKEGKEIHVWTVNKVEDMEKFANMNVNAILTDYPKLARKTLDEVSMVEDAILEIMLDALGRMD